MKPSRDFLKLTFADFIVRSAYQMGKTPLLPLFAASLGATGAFLGLIVSVSTFTGLVLKPLIGILSDRWGRRVWLLAGTAFFVGMPFLYGLVQTPEHLFVIRVIHGLATAIYGPVTLAYIAELKPDHIAESLGWFGMARSGGYIVGPAFAGWLLLFVDPVMVFTVIGLLSSLAIVPVLTLHDPHTAQEDGDKKKKRLPLHRQILTSVTVGMQTPAIWLSGVLEGGTFIALYALKAFLPVYALSSGVNVALVGVFFSVQEAAHVLAKPFSGRYADRIGYVPMIAIGLMLLGVGMFFIPASNGVGLLVPAILTGLAQAFIFPSTIALVSQQMRADTLGAGMGFIGMMQNGGKVIGPILGGLLIEWLDFGSVVYLLAGLSLLGGLLLYWKMHTWRPVARGVGD